MLGSILVLTALALAATPLSRWLRHAAGWAFGTALAAVGVFFAVQLEPGGVLTESYRWVPSLGLELSFRMDGLSATFTLLITGIGALVLIHAGGYLRGDPRLGRLFALLLFFTAAMLGLVLSDNLIALFLFWELTSVASYLLIGLDFQNAESRSSAQKALLVTGAGGIIMLVGLVLLHLTARDLGLEGGAAWQLSEILRADLRAHPLYPAIVLLLLTGAFTKSAQVPFHFWLPAAMAAPTPVSALLHSATMVKAGIYLLARVHPGLGQTVLWEVTVTAAGAATMLFAATLTLGQKDLKRILAFSTIAVLGILTMLLGVGTTLAIEAMVIFLVAHALYKASLFLIAGNVDHETGTRDVTALGGLWRAMPFTATAGILAAMSKAGAPPMFGFVGKELLYKSKLDLETIAGWLIVAAVLANVLLVASALLTGVKPFVGRQRTTPRVPHEAPWSMRLGPLVLAAVGVLVTAFPDWFDQHLASPMASAIAGVPIEMKLELWHGINPAALAVLGLSAVTLALGYLVFVRVRKHLTVTTKLAARLGRLGPAQHFDTGLAAIYRGAGHITQWLQNGRLRWYLLLTVLTAVGVLLPLAAAALRLPAWSPVRPLEAIALLLIVGGAAVAAVTSSRLTAVVGLGVTGLAMSLLFLLFGAPDLAITQIMVETLTVVLFVLVLCRGCAQPRSDSRWTRLRDLVPALVAGATMTALVLAASTVTHDAALAGWFAENSSPLAFGRNVVNVILVDFRALDTLGEITVVAVAALGVLALLRLRPEEPKA